MRHRGWLLLALAVAGLGLVVLWSRARTKADGAWLAVTRGDLELTVEVAGTLAAAESAVLGPPHVPEIWDYRISFLAPEGSEVAVGAPVLGFDTSELEKRQLDLGTEGRQADQELEQKRNQVAKTLADLGLQRAEAEAKRRKLELDSQVPPDLVAAIDAEARDLDLDLAAREVQSLDEQLRLTRERSASEIAALTDRRDRAYGRLREIAAAIAAMNLAAPRAGSVVYPTERGEEKVKIGDRVWAGRSVIEIPDLAHLRADGEADEADVGRLALGQPVAITVDAVPGREFAGRLVEIGTTVNWRSEGTPVRVVQVKVDLAAVQERRLRPGMRFRGRAETARLAGVLRLPVEAVEMTADGPLVHRRTRFGEESVHPRLGQQNGKWVEVLAGLAEGDQLRRQESAP